MRFPSTPRDELGSGEGVSGKVAACPSPTMRLLHAATFEFKDFVPKKIPEYAILSHTWENEGVLYHDVLNGTAQSELGWSKVKQCCARAQEDGFQYVCVD